MPAPSPVRPIPPDADRDLAADRGPAAGRDGPADRDLAAELAVLAEVRAALTWMLDHARMRVATGADVAGDRYTAETLGRMLRSHAKELAEEPDSPLYFGRITFDDGPDAGPHRGQHYTIGRRRITDPTGQALVIDWRAPVSARFYQASATDRRGVAARRRFGWSWTPPARLTGFEDERLDRGQDLGRHHHLLIAEIERPRVGPMRDIVATIQPDQDALVRADLAESICVQGGPGTGKTAVGLHRAAYLLYACRKQLRRTGVLVVGPNRAFLHHIATVLPALGEVDVRQCTLDGLLDERGPSTVDSEGAAAVKHDERMAAVLRRALYQRVCPPVDPVAVADGSMRLRLSTTTLARQATRILDEHLPYGVGRERLRARLVGLLQRQLEARGETPGRAWAQRAGRSRSLVAALDATWPRVRPAELLTELLSDPARLAAAADGLLTADEQATVRWRRPPRSWRSASWSAADLLLLDELAGLIEHPAGFGHIVVDEAQDLSPMQCRALARRSRHGSLTVLGDLAQGTTPWAATDWPTQLARLGRPDTPVIALTAGFRVPAAVVDLANRLLPELGVAAPPTVAVRRDGVLRVLPVTDLAGAAVDAVRQALTHEGSIAVIAADPDLAAVHAAFDAAGIPLAVAGQPQPDQRVTALPATLAKGLEFDHVVVLEPAAIVAAEPRGMHRLYVVLTRTVSRLDVLHRLPLPDIFIHQ